ncbi:retinal guanylyl cyclase 2-like [Prorops nasuta]|uniref:retinal guanylyl cyclase 2-like n=1 Tax=Prorops nasuta TaxID=863751 RepID=UPI0034CEBCAC
MASKRFNRHCWCLAIAILFPLSMANPTIERSMQHRNDTILASDKIVVYLRDKCDTDLDLDLGIDLDPDPDLDLGSHPRTMPPLEIVPKSLTCGSGSTALAALVGALKQARTKALIASLDLDSCEFAGKLATLWHKPLLTWTCPMRSSGTDKQNVIRLSPSFPSLAKAVGRVFQDLQWKSTGIIQTDEEPWSSLARAVLTGLRGIGISPRYQSVVSLRATSGEIRDSLKLVQTVPCKVILLCAPLNGQGTIGALLQELDSALQEGRKADSIILLIHPEDDGLFLPDSQSSNRTFSHFRKNRLVPAGNLSTSMLDNLLAIVPIDRRYDVQNLYNHSETYDAPSLMHRLNESLYILTRDNTSIDSNNNKIYSYTVLDWWKDKWRPIIAISEEKNSQLVLKKLITDASALADVENSSDNLSIVPLSDSAIVNFPTAHIVLIVLGSILFALLSIIIAVFVRRQVLRRRMSKIILTASDFVFPPQAAGSKRVDEGIEAMLCCWLQQLQEFGGPEVEKPDLLQGSVGSARPHITTSNTSLVRHTLLKDPRVTYNGDLVQLKDIPCQGTFELKRKAMDVIDVLHGLRHENLNPLIGCLTEPTRPCLVSEFCSRGSLEDVLVQDEIKLDWSFRLSLLTDLVRGMKYLHGTPIRVHGFLTSRNCVIDARWVLKVTDYGLPAFYKAQNISAPTKSARELLWTAPELLRRSSLREKGTQQADVYSFAIVMQEVVLRGEPFCMLALSPEDIIEKVKKPPPLIRPSVSKGAAPPEAINIMRQCWAEAPDSRPDFNDVHQLFEKLNHGRKVNFVDTMFQMLEKYSNNLEELIRERTEQLDMEKKKTEQLLNRMLPSSVAEKLKLGMPVDPEEFSEVTIYFSDIVGFTSISAYSTPFQVVDLLNDLYTCFDATINAYTVYKVETIGDAYMVVGGCPVRIADHASQIATMALDLLHQSGKFRVRHLPNTQLRLRIGLHTGPCCAGVVGLTMPRYCLFGDTVNTASRMESTGAPWRIHLSQATRDRLTHVGGYYIEYRGPTDVKGKGKMPTYWLLGKQGFDKELPTPTPFGEDHGLEESLVGEHTRKVAVSVHEDSECRNSQEASTSEVERTTYQSGGPISATEVAAALLGASTTSLTSTCSGLQQSSVISFRPGRHRRAATGIFSDEDDLSTPYNHYRCISPNNEHHGNAQGKSSLASRFLRRQFSLDRADEPSPPIGPIAANEQNQKLSAPRLYKQNSAGAANDLERIEEIPSTPSPGPLLNYRQAASVSLSVESLSLRQH